MTDINCWDFWNCPDEEKNKCEIFKLDSGNECWNLQDVNNVSCSVAQKEGVKSCIYCKFYKEKTKIKN